MITLVVVLASTSLLLLLAIILGDYNYYSSSPPAPSSSSAHGDGTYSAAAGALQERGVLLYDKPIIIRNACSNALYSSLCFSTFSSSPSSLLTTKPITDSKATNVATADATSLTFRHILEIGIKETTKFIKICQSNIRDLLVFLSTSHQSYDMVTSQEENALKDCMEMLDQTLYELHQATQELLQDRRRPQPGRMDSRMRYCLNNLRTLLSAAMTNEHTCIAGFYDLEEQRRLQGSSYSTPLVTTADVNYSERLGDHHEGLQEYMEKMLTPISQLISICLAVIKYADNTANGDNQRLLIEDADENFIMLPRKGGLFPKWMSRTDRKLMEISATEVKAHVVVAADSSGDYRSIGEAVKMAAPEGSKEKFVIKIKAGVYRENVEIPRKKVNIMLVGEGTNSTVITASRNFADGFSTFTSATLTVVGDRFLARGLSIENASGPSKHQAVAVRVTSNAAFYQCNFASYQDTLYAHSLRQFYRECTVWGSIDFIFGNAAAIFQKCVILVRNAGIPGHETVITAQGREDPNQNTGISLHNCTVVAAQPQPQNQIAATFLGRPWRNYSRTMVMRSYLGKLIHPKGWCLWNQYTNLNTLQYVEYMNVGPGSNTSHRVAWPGYQSNCSEGIAKQFTVGALFHDEAADHWLESTGFPLFHGP